ncbi:biliverdin-producing heme oxygenase [Pedobacter sp. ISL-68]|uniref:biliverdin-producing heme oxygenase n=1 Tax=unclassified Pedobacter TaxID=2628915 RepID=UPI001BEA7FD2|nr:MULTISPECIES: biliverdin-producing heme oxygenase [unclassified Pedobacter]MBT2560156.1 biliverdin-producing heme oxygenase [Pedobacter sp. ISL-64]MBT2589135.1 biliverdin-producing heme oxygenase [Pedobacter sp. ISL-68]
MLSTNIKEATKISHQELEAKVVRKLKAIRSEADYADVLKYFYAYFSSLEKAIAPYITKDVLPDYPSRRNSSYLKRDIEELGSAITDLPPVTVPAITNTVEALGALYVMEGSIMGGPYIVQMLNKGGIKKGVSFFSGYGEATGQMWGTFVEVLNNSASNEKEALAIKAAGDTFSNFSEVFGDLKVA